MVIHFDHGSGLKAYSRNSDLCSFPEHVHEKKVILFQMSTCATMHSYSMLQTLLYELYNKDPLVFWVFRTSDPQCFVREHFVFNFIISFFSKVSILQLVPKADYRFPLLIKIQKMHTLIYVWHAKLIASASQINHWLQMDCWQTDQLWYINHANTPNLMFTSMQVWGYQLLVMLVLI